MIVSSAYPSDDNGLLMEVQHDLYLRNVGALFDASRTAMVRANDLLESGLLIAEKARAVERFDHRVLRDAHDITAAAYRYRHDDGGQHRVLEAERDVRERYRKDGHSRKRSLRRYIALGLAFAKKNRSISSVASGPRPSV